MSAKRLLDINSRALYMPCACGSLNLALCDIYMDNSCGKASLKYKDKVVESNEEVAVTTHMHY